MRKLVVRSLVSKRHSTVRQSDWSDGRTVGQYINDGGPTKIRWITSLSNWQLKLQNTLGRCHHCHGPSGMAVWLVTPLVLALLLVQASLYLPVGLLIPTRWDLCRSCITQCLGWLLADVKPSSRRQGRRASPSSPIYFNHCERRKLPEPKLKGHMQSVPGDKSGGIWPKPLFS